MSRAKLECGTGKALEGSRETIGVQVRVTGLGGGKCEGDDLGKLTGFDHKKGNEAEEYISKCPRKKFLPYWGPRNKLLWPRPAAGKVT